MKLCIWIGIGGMIGASARYSISILFLELDGFPYATLTANFIGCFLLSFLANHPIIKKKLSANIRTVLGTGIIGAFTTFSTFALETTRLWDDHMLLATSYILLSICGGLLFCYLGYRIAKHRQRLDIA